MIRLLRPSSSRIAQFTPSLLGLSTRKYHTYPDADDVGTVTSHVSDIPRVSKSGSNYSVNDVLKSPGPLDRKSSNIVHEPLTPTTESTVLANGITVASQDALGMMTSFSVMIGAGSAFENQVTGHPDCTLGAAHMIELLAFKSSPRHNREEVAARMELLGGTMQCITNKENIMYCVDVLRENVGEAMELMADAVLAPQYTEDEIAEGQQVMEILINELPSDIIAKEIVQRAAYPNKRLGNFHCVPLDHIASVTVDRVKKFRQENYYAENCYISAAGIEHKYFTSLVDKHFSSMSSNPAAQAARKKLPASPFKGGLIVEQRELKEPFVKTCIGFEIGGWNSKNMVTACVLQQILGGGSSFSAGGPGKGMYTRLYRHVLNQHHWVESAQSFVQLHEDAGIIGIDAACHPNYISYIIRVIINQFTEFAVEDVTQEELDRGKNMLKSMLLMQLESRLVLCEDISRQFVTYGHRTDPLELCRQIDSVTFKDLRTIGKVLLDCPVAVGVVGYDVSQVPTYDVIEEFADKYRGEMWRKRK